MLLSAVKDQDHSRPCIACVTIKLQCFSGGAIYSDLVAATQPYGLAVPWGDADVTGMLLTLLVLVLEYFVWANAPIKVLLHVQAFRTTQQPRPSHSTDCKPTYCFMSRPSGPHSNHRFTFYRLQAGMLTCQQQHYHGPFLSCTQSCAETAHVLLSELCCFQLLGLNYTPHIKTCGDSIC